MTRATKIFIAVASVLALVLGISSAALMLRLASQPGAASEPERGPASPPPIAGAPPAPSTEPEGPTDPTDGTEASAVDSEWLASTAQSTGIPERVLQAYVAAGVWAEKNRNGCRLGWNTIAAIGSVETNHGRYGGSSVQPDGNLDTPIIGAQLNGMGVAQIDDTDGGRLDGDDEFDRAVGPMQFIPDSWNRHGLDANGDGVKDPNNIDDAAMTTASYLCVAGDMGTAPGWERAVLSYNNSLDYVSKVYNAAVLYARSVDPGAPAPPAQTIPVSTPPAAPGRSPSPGRG